MPTRSWRVGKEESCQELIAAAAGRIGASHYAWQRQESGKQKAERLIDQGLR